MRCCANRKRDAKDYGEAGCESLGKGGWIFRVWGGEGESDEREDLEILKDWRILDGGWGLGLARLRDLDLVNG